MGYFGVSLLLLSLDALRGCNVFTQNVLILSCIMLLLLFDVLGAMMSNNLINFDEQ
jgi:hypothetical protein